MTTPHISVLAQEVRAALLPDGVADRIIDGTLGAGGHTYDLLMNGTREVLAFDLDPQAIAIAREKLSEFGDRVHIVQDSYSAMATHAHALGWDAVDGILLDLGVSSMQLDTPERGFAFRHDGPLDMRFTSDDSRPSAADIVNSWSAEDMTEIFFKYGEERHSRMIARAIVKARPIMTTTALADLISASVPRPKKRDVREIHPATRVFQALRIAVNDELRVIEQVIPDAINLLRPGGRLAIISFHSLEDRIVKNAFKEASTAIVAPPGMASVGNRPASVDLITRKPIVPSDDEMADNPRSRSSKMRVVEKL